MTIQKFIFMPLFFDVSTGTGMYMVSAAHEGIRDTWNIVIVNLFHIWEGVSHARRLNRQ